MAESLQMTQVNVRALGDVIERVGGALGVPFPLAPNTVASRAERSVLWLGPDEWLVVDARASADHLEALIRACFAPDWGAVTDVSANRIVVEIAGQTARDVLARGCSLDLHPRAFGIGRCAQTLLAGSPVILWQTDDLPTFLVLVRASYASHLARWLADVQRDLVDV